MNRPSNGIVGGISGAALLGLLFVAQPKGSIPQPTSVPIAAETGGHSGEEPSVRQDTGDVPMTLDNNGPWYALCREYAGSDFEKGIVAPANSKSPRGVFKITTPAYINDGAVEITRTVKVTENANGGQVENGKAQDEEHKTPVLRRLAGDLASCVQGGQTELQVVIATVPDPVHSHMELEFDRVIEALEHAAAASGFDFERFWLPWTVPSSSPSVNPDMDRQRTREQQPGVLIFRRHPADPNVTPKSDSQHNQRLLIFLVGETPTYGLNRTAFAQALWYRRVLAPFCQNHSRIAIVGPQFSATYSSLGDVLLFGHLPRGVSVPRPTITREPTDSSVLVLARRNLGNSYPDGSRWDIKSTGEYRGRKS
jgi:hypothetical protein